jgi:thiamine biosynthesis lipoprotein
MYTIIAFKVVLILIFSIFQDYSEKSYYIKGKTMGTNYSIQTIDIKLEKLDIENRLLKINSIFSNWDKNSEISKLNNAPINEWIDISDDMFFVLHNSKQIYKQTKGFFDPGIGRLIDIWGFGSNKVNDKPNKNQIIKSLELSSIKNLQLADKKVRKLKDIHINLSAIAKGYAVDEIVKFLLKKGVNKFIVEIGGEVAAYGKDWKIGVEFLNFGNPININLKNKTIATSGDYRNYFIWDGKKYAHILNPNNGLPAKTDLSSVSVIHNSNMLADAYATAILAMGYQKAAILAKRLNLSVLFILDEKNHFKVLKINL